MSGSRTLFASVAVSCLVLVLAGCGDSGGAGAIFAAPATASFSPSGSPVTENQVRLVGRSTGDDEVTIQVVVAGPTESDDIYGFYFGLEVGDPAVATFVPGSPQLGPALDTSGCSAPVLFVSSYPAQPGLLIVSMTKLGNCPGNEIPAGEETVISLTFRVEPEASTTIRLSGQNATDNPWVSDSEREAIDSMIFDRAAARFSGR